MELGWKIWTFFKSDRLRIGASFLLLAATTLAGLVKPWPLALILDCALGHRPLPNPWAQWLEAIPAFDLLTKLTLLLVAVHCGHALLTATQNGVIIHLGLRGLMRVRAAVFDWLLRLSFSRWNAFPQGDLLYRATWDTFAFQTLFTQGVFGVISASTQVVAMTLVMTRINISLTVISMVTVPILVAVMRFWGRRMSQFATIAQSADASISTRFQQTLTNLLVIQSFTREPEESSGFKTTLQAAFVARWRQHRVELVYLMVVACVLGSGTSILVWSGARLVQDGKLSIGELWVFLAYLAHLYEPLNQLSQLGTTVTNSLAGTRRVIEIMNESDEVPDGKRTFQWTPNQPPRIRFQEVAFSYDGEIPALDSTTFNVEPGQVMAIIGPSGAGKTTLLQLIPRFLEPRHGRVEIAGVNVREYDRRSLRTAISVLLQEPLLLPTTVAQNLAFGNPDISREQLILAARQANADEFIRRLPNGYDTIIGDGAARLSVGEKQRLNLARAFLKNAPILLLDEPTSALDGESETLILEGMKVLTRHRTTLMVAHRLSTLRIADQVMVLRKGRVEAMGMPSEILKPSLNLEATSGR